MIIAIASGKGGTGKTTFAVNSASVFDGQVQLLDCDVEEPNCHIFLHGEHQGTEVVTTLVPEVIPDRCDGCHDCAQFCRFNAVLVVNKQPMFFHDLCHSCGGCTLICARRAIREIDRRIGVIDTFVKGNITLQQGKIDVGIAMAPPLIKKLRDRAKSDIPIIIDAPPGTSCPVMASIRGADVVVLVTEPTPFGLHDLDLAVKMVRAIGLPHGVVINRAGSGDDRISVYCREQNIPVLGQIPEDRRIAETYSRGLLIVDELPDYRKSFHDILRQACKLAGSYGEVIHADLRV